jgi:cytochrome c peroxidase
MVTGLDFHSRYGVTEGMVFRVNSPLSVVTGRWIPLIWIVLVGFDLTGCDTATAPKETEDLDAELTALLTRDGQRGLNNFMLPDENDFSAMPQDPGNPLTPEKVTLGKLLFHDPAAGSAPRLEPGRGTYSCATCHHASAGFQSGLQQAISEGGMGWGDHGENRAPDPMYGASDLDVQSVKTPSILNSAYQRVLLWDGSLGSRGPNNGTEEHWTPGSSAEVNNLGYDGLESQAIAGLTDHRMSNVGTSVIAAYPEYQQLWDAVFPGEPVTLEKAGLAIAAYERTIYASRAPFQRWLRGEVKALTTEQKRGAILFFGKAGCEQCHTGPPLNSVGFYALGMPDMSGPNVYGPVPETMGRGGFLNDPGQYYKFKIPQLYNLADSPFYGHGGVFQSIREVVSYYNDGIPEKNLPDGILDFRFKPLNLTSEEVDQITAFLSEALRDRDLKRYVPERVPSGNCFPANDSRSRSDLGCN